MFQFGIVMFVICLLGVAITEAKKTMWFNIFCAGVTAGSLLVASSLLTYLWMTLP